jgi:hypothetical protein
MMGSIMNHEFIFPTWMGEAPRANSPWTEEEEKLVIDNYKIGYSIKALAELTGRKETGILNRLENKFPELRQVRQATQELINIGKELDRLIEKAHILKKSLKV